MGVIFGLPVVSIFIFIAAGLLLGHLFWYRDTGSLDTRILELENELAAAGEKAIDHFTICSEHSTFSRE